jgi:hypothetical protein
MQQIFHNDKDLDYSRLSQDDQIQDETYTVGVGGVTADIQKSMNLT